MGTEKRSSFEYVAALDGLRAIAVLGVLIFHAVPTALKGGFVGVDVFFVLSGYLITSIILHDLRDGSFSLRRFYERRIQRLLPNATLTIFVTVLLWLILLTPSAALSTAKHGLATMFSLSNFYLVEYAGGYWSTSASSFPLLHTWSLAVEEQFYLIFPTILWLIVRRPGRRAILIVGGMLSALLVLGIGMSHYYPDAAFYLLPSRMWELLLGAMLAALYVRSEGRHPERSPRAVRAWDVGGWLGLAGVWAAYFLISDQSQLSGAVALLPTVGTLLVLTAVARNAGSLNRVLSWKPFVKVGRVSYSLYLWHWPLIVFGRDYALMAGWPEYVGIVLGVVSGISLSLLAYHFVEVPLRRRGAGRRRRLLTIATGFATCLFFLAAVFAWNSTGSSSGKIVLQSASAAMVTVSTQSQTGARGSQASTSASTSAPTTTTTTMPSKVELSSKNGLIYYYQPVYKALAYDADFTMKDAMDLATSLRFQDMFFPPVRPEADHMYTKGGVVHLWGAPTPEVMVIGSSHAMMYAAQIDAICSELKLSVAFFVANGHPVIPDAVRGKAAAYAPFYQSQARYLTKWKPRTVLVIDRWDCYEQGNKTFVTGFDQFLGSLAAMHSHAIVLTQPPAMSVGDDVNLREFAAKALSRNLPPPPIRPDRNEAYRLATVRYLQFMAAKYPNMQLLRPDLLFYNPDKTVKYVSEHQFLYADDDHLTEAGAAMVGPLIEQAIIKANDLTVN